MRKVFFISNLIDESLYKRLYIKEKKPGQQIQKFNRLIVEGISKNGRDIQCFSVIPSSKDILDITFKKVKDEGIFHYTSILNVSPIIKCSFHFINAFFGALFREKGNYLVDPLSFDNALGSMLANRLRKNKTVSIITDLPEYMSDNQLFIKIINMIISLSDGYIVLTKETNDVINTENKPWILMEGLVDKDLEETSVKEKKKQIIYAGAINNRNGVKNLFVAFKQVGLDDYELHFYGNGVFEKELEELCENEDSIFYHGSIYNEELMDIEKKAMLLINPRPVDQDFTVYSFPSKTLEYMSTGTYSACTHLASIPEEYFEFIGDLKSGSIEDLMAFLEVFKKQSQRELIEKGMKAKQFVLAKKNNVLQAKRILELFERIDMK